MVDEALAYYNFSKPNVQLIRHNENMTYLVVDQARKYVLRIHKSVEGLDLSKGTFITPQMFNILQQCTYINSSLPITHATDSDLPNIHSA